MEALGKLLSPSGETDLNRVRAITSTLATDPRNAALKPAFREAEALVRDGDSLRALELKIEVVNGIWERSQKREVARDAFFRRIRGKDFNPIRYLDPLTSDRGSRSGQDNAVR